MATFVALLRGVNVGKANRVPMAELRALLCGLGYSKVSTLLNSGNAVFSAVNGTSAIHAADICAAIACQLKVAVPVIAKSANELEAIVAENPFNVKVSDHSRFLIAFAQDKKALSGLAVIESLVMLPERFAVGKNAAYLDCPNGIRDSKAALGLLGKAGKFATTRNLATVLKLKALANDAEV